MAVVAEVPDTLCPARANPEKLQRVLFNLIQNAIRHTPADGSVVVRAEPVADRDRGRGRRHRRRDRARGARARVHRVLPRRRRRGAHAARAPGSGWRSRARSSRRTAAGSGWPTPPSGTRVRFSLPARRSGDRRLWRCARGHCSVIANVHRPAGGKVFRDVASCHNEGPPMPIAADHALPPARRASAPRRAASIPTTWATTSTASTGPPGRCAAAARTPRTSSRTPTRACSRSRACCAPTTTSATCCACCATRTSRACAPPRAARAPIPSPTSSTASRTATPTDPRRRSTPSELYAQIAGLPDPFREALVAIDVVGLSYREAARALRVREATITTRLYRARRRLADGLGDSSLRTMRPTSSAAAPSALERDLARLADGTLVGPAGVSGSGD